MVPMDLNVGETRVWRLDSGPNLQPLKRNDYHPTREKHRKKSIPNFFPVVFASEELVQEGDAHIVLSTYWLGAPRRRCFLCFFWDEGMVARPVPTGRTRDHFFLLANFFVWKNVVNM